MLKVLGLCKERMTRFPARKYDQINVSVRKISGWRVEPWVCGGLGRRHGMERNGPAEGSLRDTAYETWYLE